MPIWHLPDLRDGRDRPISERASEPEDVGEEAGGGDGHSSSRALDDEWLRRVAVGVDRDDVLAADLTTTCNHYVDTS